VASEDASTLGIRELIDESTTAFAGAILRSHNIQLARLDERSRRAASGRSRSQRSRSNDSRAASSGLRFDNRRQSGGVHTVPSVAGGICQVATTLFQPCSGGLSARGALLHLYWIRLRVAWLVGLDATVDQTLA